MILPPRLVDIERTLPAEILACYSASSSCDVSDAVGDLYTLDPAISALYRPMPPMVGAALTVKAPPGDNLAILEALRLAGPGDVLVVDWRGHTASAGSGSLVLRLAQSQGLLGVVIDGAWRDIGEVAKLGLPIFGRSVAAVSPPKARPGEINVAVHCGGVIVNPGDVVVGDEEGIAVVPRRHALLVGRALREKADVALPSLEKLASNAATRGERYGKLFADSGGEREVGSCEAFSSQGV